MTTSLLRRSCLALTICASLLAGCQPSPSAVPSNAPTLTLALLPDYLPETLITDFEAETGIRVHVATFESYEMLNAQLVAGHSGYDLVVGASGYLGSQLQAGFFQPLNKELLDRWSNLDEAVLRTFEGFDPGNRFFAPWAIGYTGVGVNRPLVEEAIGDLPWPEDAWRLLFDPMYAARVSSCGLALLDAPTEVMPAMAHYLGLPTYSTEPEHMERILEQLRRIRPYVRIFSTQLIDSFASGQVCAGLVWGGDMFVARERMEEADATGHIEAIIPEGGTFMFADALAIPAGSQQVEAAHLFINHYLRAEQAAAMTNELAFVTGNRAAEAFIDPDMLADQSFFLTAETLTRLVPPGSYDNQQRALVSDAYTRFRGGR